MARCENARLPAAALTRAQLQFWSPIKNGSLHGHREVHPRTSASAAGRVRVGDGPGERLLPAVPGAASEHQEAAPSRSAVEPPRLLSSPTEEPRAEVQLAELGRGQGHAEARRDQSRDVPKAQQHGHSGADGTDHKPVATVRAGIHGPGVPSYDSSGTLVDLHIRATADSYTFRSQAGRERAVVHGREGRLSTLTSGIS